MTFLKAALNAQRKAHGEPELTTPDFMRAVKDAGRDLHIDSDMLKRALNVGFSGGEKKRAEILQMALLKPKMCVLDETDSGLDIDALKVVSEGVNALRVAWPLDAGDHPLSAAAEPHRTGRGACVLGRQDRRERRQGAGAASSKPRVMPGSTRCLEATLQRSGYGVSIHSPSGLGRPRPS